MEPNATVAGFMSQIGGEATLRCWRGRTKSNGKRSVDTRHCTKMLEVVLAGIWREKLEVMGIEPFVHIVESDFLSLLHSWLKINCRHLFILFSILLTWRNELI